VQKILGITSAALLSLTACSVFATYHLENRRHSIQIGRGVSIAAFEGFVWFDWGPRPYPGNLAKISGRSVPYEDGQVHATKVSAVTVWGYGLQDRTFTGERSEFIARDMGVHLVGFWYRCMHWKNEVRVGWVAVSLWYLPLLFAILPGIWVLHRVFGCEQRQQVLSEQHEKNIRTRLGAERA
jgi:hypothetical protein